MGVAAIAAFLNESGYVKKKRQNNTIDGFAASFVKGVIDNPELIKKMVTSPDFEKGIREKIAARVDTSELEQELNGLNKKMRQLEVSKDKIAIQMDNLDVTDSMYEKKYDD